MPLWIFDERLFKPKYIFILTFPLQVDEIPDNQRK